MTYTARALVTVGVDGSPASLEAVAWATREARRHGRAINLVYVNTWPAFVYAMWPNWGPPNGRDGEAAGREALARAVLRARAVDESILVSTEVVEGGPAGVLLTRAARSALLVVGRRGVGGFGDLLLGSVATQVVNYACCPVAVVPERTAPRNPDLGVVLGVDGGQACQAAIGYAFTEASLRRVPLTAVRAWYWPADDPALVEPLAPLPENRQAEQRRVVSEALAGWAEKYPDVAVRTVVTHHRPAHALLHSAQGAELLVVGARGSGGFAALLLGSVGETVIRHATCPVAVARGESTGS